MTLEENRNSLRNGVSAAKVGELTRQVLRTANPGQHHGARANPSQLQLRLPTPGLPREHVQQPRMQGMTRQTVNPSTMANDNTRRSQKRDRDFASMQNRPATDRNHQVRRSVHDQDQRLEFSAHDALQEVIQRSPNVLPPTIEPNFVSQMQYPGPERQPRGRQQQQQQDVSSHDYQPQFAFQNQGGVATAPVPRGERYDGGRSVAARNTRRAQPSRPVAIAARPSQQANPPAQRQRNATERPGHQRGEGIFPDSSPVAEAETFQVPVVWMPFLFPSPERNDGWHQATSNMPGGQFELRLQMLQHPSNAPLNRGDPVLIYSNSESNIGTTPHRNVTVANNGGNVATPQDQGDAQDPNNHHADNQDNLEPQVHALQASESELLTSLCRRHACSNECGLYPTSHVLDDMYENFREICPTLCNSLRNYLANVRREFQRMRSDIRNSHQRCGSGQNQNSENSSAEDQSARYLYDAYLRRMVRTRAIQDILREWPDYTGRLGNRLRPNIPSSLEVYFRLLYTNSENKKSFHGDYLRLFYSSQP